MDRLPFRSTPHWKEAFRCTVGFYMPKLMPFDESDLREGCRSRRRHDPPLTTSDRLLYWSGLYRQGRQRIEALQQQCDPVALDAADGGVALYPCRAGGGPAVGSDSGACKQPAQPKEGTADEASR